MMLYRYYPLRCRPIDLLALCREQPGVFLLESSVHKNSQGRFSFLGFAPFVNLAVNDLAGYKRLANVHQRFSQQLNLKKSPTPFPAGMMGALSYDFGFQLENLASRFKPDQRYANVMLGGYDAIVTIDHFKQTIIISSSGLPETTPEKQKKRAVQRLNQIEKILYPAMSGKWQATSKPALSKLKLQSHMTRKDYLRQVQKALAYIRRGDIYQVNLSQKFTARGESPVDPLGLYQRLQLLSPSCYSGYWDQGKYQIVSSSPELFLEQRGSRVMTRPMKGTRPRGKSVQEDKRLRRDLKHSSKEKAELLMITDLERNDLGRVCLPGSIKVERLRDVEEYRTVFQATSSVTGRLQDPKNSFAVLRACFPGGSITGCPKIRAMEIIDELESCGRGYYTGALGYAAFSPSMAFNILIRTLIVEGHSVHFHVGGGIVADSGPDAEYQETLIKARAIKECLCGQV